MLVVWKKQKLILSIYNQCPWLFKAGKGKKKDAHVCGSINSTVLPCVNDIDLFSSWFLSRLVIGSVVLIVCKHFKVDGSQKRIALSSPAEMIWLFVSSQMTDLMFPSCAADPSSRRNSLDGKFAGVDEDEAFGVVVVLDDSPFCCNCPSTADCCCSNNSLMSHKRSFFSCPPVTPFVPSLFKSTDLTIWLCGSVRRQLPSVASQTFALKSADPLIARCPVLLNLISQQQPLCPMKLPV